MGLRSDIISFTLGNKKKFAKILELLSFNKVI